MENPVVVPAIFHCTIIVARRATAMTWSAICPPVAQITLTAGGYFSARVLPDGKFSTILFWLVWMCSLFMSAKTVSAE